MRHSPFPEPMRSVGAIDVPEKATPPMPERTANTSAAATDAARRSTKAPPAWLISACMLAFAVVTIVLVVTGQ